MASAKKWYVEATGHTNEVIASELSAENAHKSVLCQDGEKRDLWECTYRFVSQLLKNEVEGQLQFKVFYRESSYGPVKPWPFLRKKRLTLATALKEGVVKKAQPSP